MKRYRENLERYGDTWAWSVDAIEGDLVTHTVGSGRCDSYEAATQEVAAVVASLVESFNVDDGQRDADEFVHQILGRPGRLTDALAVLADQGLWKPGVPTSPRPSNHWVQSLATVHERHISEDWVPLLYCSQEQGEMLVDHLAGEGVSVRLQDSHGGNESDRRPSRIQMRRRRRRGRG